MENQKIEAHSDSAHVPTKATDIGVERRINRKIDIRVIPVLWLLFLVSFIDRSNIGNAKIEGMVKDLHLIGNRYNIAVQVFTVAYVAFSVPANLVCKWIGPKSLAVMMMFWGITVVGQGITRSYGGLVACRFLEGLFEAGFVPGAANLIGSYYKRDEFLKRYAFFFGAAILAGAVNGLLAFAISHMSGVDGYKGWRWIFILEGCTTVLVSMISFFIIPSTPEHCKFLSPEEKNILLARLKADSGTAENDELSLWKTLSDWKTWLATIIYICAEENASSIVNFQPTVLKGLGYASSAAQVHTIPVYMVAWVLSITCAVLADRLRQRYVFAVFGTILMTIGSTIEVGHPKAPQVRYAGMFFLTAGSYIVMPVTVVWLAINLGKGYKRTIGLGVLIGVGNCGAFISSNVFLTQESPRFHTGFAVGLAMSVVCFLALTIMYVMLRLENKTMGQKQSSQGEIQPAFQYAM